MDCRGSLYHGGKAGEGDSVLYMFHGTLWPKECGEFQRNWAREKLHLIPSRPATNPPHCKTHVTSLVSHRFGPEPHRARRDAATDAANIRMKEAQRAYRLKFEAALRDG